MKIQTSDRLGYYAIIFLACILLLFVGDTYAAESFGKVADKVTGSFTNLAKLITAGSYLGGLGFSIGAIMKFKQHKDNPTQIPVGTPIALVFIAAALLFLPSILSSIGGSMFSEPSTAGPTGTLPGVDDMKSI